MARNQEKAQTMLARWLRFRESEYTTGPKKRPYLAAQCDDLHSAEKFRGQIIREIGAQVTEIQNASLGEHRIRDLNDEINKLFREKYHWQRRIVQLGGVDYNKREFRNKDFAGMTLATGGASNKSGYMYFGAAKDLPGVRELLSIKMEQDTLRRKGKLYLSKDRVTGQLQHTRKECYQMIDGCDYYGFRDDDDGILAKYEKQKEVKARNSKIQGWNKKNKNKNASLCKDNEKNDSLCKDNGNKKMRRTRITSMRVPSQKEIDSIILEKRKQILLQKYETDTTESKQLATQLKMDDKIKQTRMEMDRGDGDVNNNDKSNNSENNRNETNEDVDMVVTKMKNSDENDENGSSNDNDIDMTPK